MSETNWTKGPWFYHIKGDRHVMSGQGGMPCICQTPKNKHGKNEEWIANASLIAAAPELYDALENLVSVVYGEGGTAPNAHQAAIAALAKARGES